MAQWHSAYPISAAVELVSAIDLTDRIRVSGGDFEVTGHPQEGSIEWSRGDVESHAKFQISPLREHEPITDEADRHTVVVDIFENADRDDVSDVTARVRPMDGGYTDTIAEFPVDSVEVLEELHQPELLANEEFDSSEIDDPERASRLARVDELVREGRPYYAALHEIGGGKVDEPDMAEAVEALEEMGYVRQRGSGMYELTPAGERIHTAFSDYIYGDPG